MKYIASIFLLVSATFSQCQNIDTEEQGELEDVWANKQVKIFKIIQL